MEVPFLFEVVDFELAVGRYKGGLDWGQVDAGHFDFGVFVCEVNGPNPSAASDVKNAVNGFLVEYRIEVELAALCEYTKMVLKVWGLGQSW